VDGVADDIGGAFLALGSLGHGRRITRTDQEAMGNKMIWLIGIGTCALIVLGYIAYLLERSNQIMDRWGSVLFKELSRERHAQEAKQRLDDWVAAKNLERELKDENSN
jgi:hypothetical protein